MLKKRRERRSTSADNQLDDLDKQADSRPPAGDPPGDASRRLLDLGNRLNGRRRAAHRRPRRYRRLLWALTSLTTVMVLGVGAIAGYAWHLNGEIRRIPIQHLTTAPKVGATKGTENILMVGSTSRCALKVQNPAYGLCSAGVDGVNSDVVMILHLNYATHAISVLSIPRDLFVPNARQEGANKIDAALYEGPSQLVDAIQEDFGIPIQHYVELNFETFAGVVNALGGIKMYFPEPVYDSYSGLNIATPGCVSLNGVQALQVVRARHLQYRPAAITTSDVSTWPYDPQSDLSRIRRDHEFLRVLATAVGKKGIGDPITDSQIVSSLAPDLQVDSGLSAGHLVNLVLDFHGVNASTTPQLTLPVTVDLSGPYHYKGGNYGDVVWPDQPQDQQVVEQFLGVSPFTNTMTGAALPSAATVAVSVRNGSGVAEQATATATALKALGFPATVAGDSPSVGTESETVVYYPSTAPGAVAAAQVVAHALSGYVIMALDPTKVTPGAQVTVVTGSNFTVNRPAPPASPTTSASGTSTSVPATPVAQAASSTSAANAPTAAVEPLQPWDPRSCTATGGEGA
jgi:LCP family protein required for cell wall assembly